MRFLLQRVFILIFLFIFSKANAQNNKQSEDNLYLDAQKLLYLSTLKGDSIYNQALKFQEKYKLAFLTEKTEIGSDYHYSITFTSPFLSNLTFEPLIVNKYLTGSGNYYEQEKRTFLNNKITKLDATNVASGMARFLAQRAQAELTESFFWSMQKKIEKIPELQFFFPKTYYKLKEIKNLNLHLDIDILRNSFEGDISNFQDRVYHLTQENSIKGKRHLEYLHQFLTENSIGQFIGLGMETIGNNKEIHQPMVLLSNFTRSNIANKIKNKNTLNYNLFSTIQLLEITPQLLTSPSSKGNILTKDELSTLVSDDKLLKVYLALFLAKTRSFNNTINTSRESIRYAENNNIDTIKFIFNSIECPNYINLNNKTSLESIIEKYYKNDKKKSITELKNLILSLHNNIKSLNTKLDKEQFKASKNYYRTIYNIAFNSVIETINQLNNYKEYNDSEIATSIETFNTYTSTVLDIADSFRAKNYRHGIASLVQVLNLAVPNINDNDEFINNSDESQTKEILKTYLEKDKNYKIINKIQDSIAYLNLTKENLLSTIDSLDIEDTRYIIKNYIDNKEFRKFARTYHAPYNDFVRKLNTYGNLFAAVALAETSDDIKAAIESTALPTGSSRLKRTSNYSITLNAYVGAFAGKAFYKELNVDGIQKKKEISTFGITAPIGISFSKGLLGLDKNPSTLSFTLQLIDLGSLVNFYVKKGDGAQLPNDTKIQLGDILAPGTQLSYSIGDSPFTIMAGMQYVPNLSRIEESNTNFKPLTWRAQLGLTVDIPLFNLKVWQ